MGTQRKAKSKVRNTRQLSRLEIAELITRIENRDREAFKFLTSCYSKESLRKTVCFTGPGGVGKSTLLARLVSHTAKRKSRSVSWLACDPWSPVSGGSLLGDRIRLSGEDLPQETYIRSLSTRSAQAFSQAIRDIEIFMESMFEEVWVETAGSGQTQTEIADISALTVLVLQPEIGDEIQWMKSGLRELVDLFVINKSDLGGADSMARSLIELGARQDQVLICSSKEEKGISEILDAIDRIRQQTEWNSKVSRLQSSLAEALFKEQRVKKLEREFSKVRKVWIQNPYKPLIKA